MGDPSEEIQNKAGQQSPIMSCASTDDEFVENEKLFEAVVKNKWEEVVTTYKNSHRAREAKLTSKSEDTALHIAVSNNKTKSALEMVDTIDKDVLMTIQNAKGNTPLHLAAMLGNLKICEKLVEKNSNLPSVQNKHGETPIFLAVRHGQPDVFSFLHRICPKFAIHLAKHTLVWTFSPWP